MTPRHVAFPGRLISRGWSRWVASILTLAMLAAACSSGSGKTTDTAPAPAQLRVVPLSAPAKFVTGGDLLVGIDSPAGLSLDQAKVTVDGKDVTDRFRLDQSQRPPGASVRLVGLVDGLPDGKSTITAQADGTKASIEVDNHPIDGPLFSGPHQSPFVCTTAANGLGAPGDNCWAQTRVSWKYVDTNGNVNDLADPAKVPENVATTTVASNTTAGNTNGTRTVPFVIRVEQGVFNRSIATYAVLDPHPGSTQTGSATGNSTATGADGTPGNRASGVRAWDPSGWNGRLVMRFGGGCGATYSQGQDNVDPVDTGLLAKGYAVVASSLTNFATACNSVVSAETAEVLKEHFSETYGLPRVTIGEGGSGGAIQQLQIVQNYPGILDAIAPSMPFPDAISIAGGVTDCGLLLDYFGGAGSSLSQEQRNAIVGFSSTRTCEAWKLSFLPLVNPSVGCDPALAGQVFDAATRPRGVRCTLQDSNVNIFGVDPATGYAQRPIDNVGVQYGLDAVNRGIITIPQFLDLNAGIGGYDINGNHVAQRETAPDSVFERAYKAGQVTAASVNSPATNAPSTSTLTGALDSATAGGLVNVPIILTNIYTDDLGDIHDRERVFAIAQRLQTPDGAPDPNLAIWTRPAPSDLTSLAAGGDTAANSVRAVTTLDQWVTAAQNLGDAKPMNERLAQTKPATAVDSCLLPDGKTVTGADIYADGSPCANAYPLHSSPRQVAGAPLSGDILACKLVPVDPTSSMYKIHFTEEQAARLRQIFPRGVCDWSVPGRGQVAPDGTWQVFDTP